MKEFLTKFKLLRNEMQYSFVSRKIGKKRNHRQRQRIRDAKNVSDKNQLTKCHMSKTVVPSPNSIKSILSK